MAIIYFLMGALFGLLGTNIFKRFTTNETLLSLLIVIMVVFGMTLAKFYAIPYYRALTFEYFLKRDDPQMNLIANNFPEEYRVYLSNIKTTILNDQNQSYEILDQVAFLNIVFAKILPLATNESIYNYYTAELAFYADLFKIDPKLVVFMEFPNKFSNKPDPTLLIGIAGSDLIKKIISAKEDVILSEIKTPQHADTPEETTQAMDSVSAIISELSDKYGEDNVKKTILEPSSNDMDMKIAALIIMNFYQAILERGVNKAGDIFEYLVTPK